VQTTVENIPHEVMIGTDNSPKSTLIKALNNEHKRKKPEELVPVK